MSEIKISKLEKYSNFNLVYELENDDFIINEILSSDETLVKSKRKIGFYIDEYGEKNNINIHLSELSSLIIEFESNKFINQKNLDFDSIDLDTIKKSVLYLVDRYKKHLTGEKIEVEKIEKNLEDQNKEKQLENDDKIKIIKNEIEKNKLTPSNFKPTLVDEDKWALWIRKLDTIYLELEVISIDLDNNLININFLDSQIEEKLLVENSISSDGKLDLDLFMKSIKSYISLLVKNTIKY